MKDQIMKQAQVFQFFHHNFSTHFYVIFFDIWTIVFMCTLGYLFNLIINMDKLDIFEFV